jgi:dipeptidase E
MKLLLISNSTNRGEGFLTYPMPYIKNFLGEKPLKCLFIPYASVRKPFDELTFLVKERFDGIGQTDLTSIHTFSDPVKAVEEAEAIIVSGGSTWNLLYNIRKNNLIEPIRKKVLSGTPYIGWSAGSNLACPTIKTTNDMPIIDPMGFDALNLIPFQINPHFLGTEDDMNVKTHGGETREERIEEFLIVNPDICVVGLREGCMFQIEDNNIKMIGKRTLRVFKHGTEAKEYEPKDNLEFLLEKR